MEVTYQLTPEDREAVIDRLLDHDPMMLESIERIRKANRNSRLLLAGAVILLIVGAFQLRPDSLLSEPVRAVVYSGLLFLGIFAAFGAVRGGRQSPKDQCREALNKINWMELRGSTDTVFCDGTEFRVSGEAGYEVSRPGSIERVDADERVILVYKPNQTMVSIPKRAFASSEDADAFVALVRQLTPADR